MAESDKVNLELNFFLSHIKRILVKQHKDTRKHRIVIYPSMSNPNRINFSCPVCGDSDKAPGRKMRGNLWMNTAFFECYNCETKFSFLKLCQNFNERLELDERVQLLNYVEQNIHHKEKDFTVQGLEKLLSFPDYINFLNTSEQSFLTDVKPIQFNSIVFKYLEGRLIKPNEFLYQGVYKTYKANGDCKFQTPVLVLLNRSGDKLLGMQLRNLESDKSKRFFKILDFSYLYNRMHPDDPIDDLEAIGYNKLSHFFNILNVDFEQPVTIFEGFLDAQFCPNSIGMVGAKNDEDLLKFLTNADDNLKLRFFYDRDVTGQNKADKMLKKGYDVFSWNRFLEKMRVDSGEYYNFDKRLTNIMDLNDVVKEFNIPNVYEKFKLYNFFAKDEFDKLFLPKYVSPARKYRK